MTNPFFYLASAAFAVEVLTYLLYPRPLVGLARLPVGSRRRVALAVPVLQKLTRKQQTDAQGKVHRELDLTRVSWPALLRTDAVVGRAAGGSAWLRLQQVGWRPQGWAVVRITSGARGDDVMLRVSFVPVPFLAPILLLAGLGLTVATNPAGAVAAAFGAGLLLGIWGAVILAIRSRVQRTVAPVLAELADGLATAPRRALEPPP